MPLPRLPIDEVLGELIEASRQHSAVLLRAPTGAGKTTRVPGALLDAGLAGRGEVIVLEPRRIAARAAAQRTASERGARLGGEVGYRVRFDSKHSRDTRITYVTEGLFLRRLQQDPLLEGVSLVIFDEFHERNLDGDLSLALVRRVQEEVRDDLRLVVMSATLDTEPLRRFLGDPPLVESQGRTHPVEIEYLSAAERPERGIPDAECVRQGVRRALAKTAGDVLVFLPGVGEIKRCAELLRPELARAGHALFELYGDQSPAEQDRALATHAGRAVHLATNVAETSLTLPQVTAVVDSGLARKLQHDPARGLNQLSLQPISRASATQRAGRAGRTSAGWCLRLWTEHDERSRPAEEEAEVRRIEVSNALLGLLAFGESKPLEFPWFEAPPLERVESALSLLQNLGAVKSQDGASRLTEIGQQLAGLPLHPRIGRLLIEGAARGVTFEAATCAALLSERSPFRSSSPAPTSWHSSIDSDLIDRLHAVIEYEEGGSGNGLHRGSLRALLRVRDQLERLVDSSSGLKDPEARDELMARALLLAFPDRLARRREPGDDRALMIGGRGVRLARESTVREAELFLCLEITGHGQDGLVRQASEVRREWLDPRKILEETRASFDRESERIVSEKVVAFDGLVLDARPAKISRNAKTSRVLEEAAAANLERALDLSNRNYTDWVARVHSLGAWMPELELPRIDSAFLLELLPSLCAGKLSFAELRKQSLADSVRAALDWRQLEALERHAPERIEVPSGKRHRLTYEEGRPPVLAARIQDLFGWSQTPRVAGGRVPILLHLLAPNMRPQQVTDDLESFWNNTYAEVRKDLRRRYPKHDWPEDPWTAKAKRRPGR